MKNNDTVLIRFSRRWLIKLIVWAVFALTSCARAYFYARAGNAGAWDEAFHTMWVTFVMIVALHLIEENS